MTRRISLSQRDRGSAVVAILVALAMIQILVAAIVLSGSRSDTLTSLRLDNVRSFYAAEAGANIAAREVILGVDADSDGGIGSVSNDGNAANNPAIGLATVSATASTAGDATTIIVTGVARQTARRVTLTIDSP